MLLWYLVKEIEKGNHLSKEYSAVEKEVRERLIVARALLESEENLRDNLKKKKRTLEGDYGVASTTLPGAELDDSFTDIIDLNSNYIGTSNYARTVARTFPVMRVAVMYGEKDSKIKKMLTRKGYLIAQGESPSESFHSSLEIAKESFHSSLEIAKLSPLEDYL